MKLIHLHNCTIDRYDETITISSADLSQCIDAKDLLELFAPDEILSLIQVTDLQEYLEHYCEVAVRTFGSSDPYGDRNFCIEISRT